LHRLHNRSLCNPHGLGDLLGLGDLGDWLDISDRWWILWSWL